MEQLNLDFMLCPIYGRRPMNKIKEPCWLTAARSSSPFSPYTLSAPHFLVIYDLFLPLLQHPPASHDIASRPSSTPSPTRRPPLRTSLSVPLVCPRSPSFLL